MLFICYKLTKVYTTWKTISDPSAVARVSVVYLSSTCQWHQSTFTSIRESAPLKHQSTNPDRRERKLPSHFTAIQEEKEVFYECKVDLLKCFTVGPNEHDTIEESGSRRRSIFIERVKDPWFTSHGESFSLQSISLKSPVERDRVRESEKERVSERGKIPWLIEEKQAKAGHNAVLLTGRHKVY